MSTTTKPATVRTGSIVFNSAGASNGYHVATTPQEIQLAPGEFVISNRWGYRTIGRLTGRTRRHFGLDCPTIDRFEVETFADEDGVIWGRRSDERIPGPAATRPENVRN